MSLSSFFQIFFPPAKEANPDGPANLFTKTAICRILTFATVDAAGAPAARKVRAREMSGRLIVFEGTDGSGKSTQFSRLCRRMEEAGAPFHRIVFPQYQEPRRPWCACTWAGSSAPTPQM